MCTHKDVWDIGPAAHPMHAVQSDGTCKPRSQQAVEPYLTPFIDEIVPAVADIHNTLHHLCLSGSGEEQA